MKKFKILISPLVAFLLCTAGVVAMPSATSASTGTTVLINGDTLSSSRTINEANSASALGYTVTVVTGEQWDAMTAAQFAAYTVLVIGDPTCTTTMASSVTSNESVWAPVVMGRSIHTQSGNRILIGTDPVYHAFYGVGPAQGKQNLINDGLKYAASTRAGTTGLYLDTSCSMPSTSILDQLTTNNAGSWTVSTPDCLSNVSLISSNASFGALSSSDLGGWHCSVHSTYPTFPSDWYPLAVATDAITTPVCGIDVTTSLRACGEPYILVAGSDIVVTAPDISVSPLTGSTPVGNSYRITATVTTAGVPTPGYLVSFSVTGANNGVTGTCFPANCVSDSSGHVTFTYTNYSNVGNDTISAIITAPGGIREQATSSETWTAVQDSGPTLPDKPLNLSVSVPRTGGILTLSWSPVPDNGSGVTTGYICNGGASSSISVKTTSCTFTGNTLVIANNTASLSVVTVNASGISEPATLNVQWTAAAAATAPTFTTTTMPPVMSSITCVGGKITKKVTGVSPVCPKGYHKQG